MRRKAMLCILVVSAVMYCTSCARGISPFEAANGKAKCGKYLR